MVVFGGLLSDPPTWDTTWFADGGEYDPTTNTWTPIGWCDPPRAGYAAVWTGSRMLLYGGDNDTPTWLRGRRFTP